MQAMVDRCMDRESLRVKGKKAMKSTKKVLSDLGKLAWQGLNETGKKLIFEKVRFYNKNIRSSQEMENIKPF